MKHKYIIWIKGKLKGQIALVIDEFTYKVVRDAPNMLFKGCAYPYLQSQLPDIIAYNNITKILYE